MRVAVLLNLAQPFAARNSGLDMAFQFRKSLSCSPQKRNRRRDILGAAAFLG